MFKTGDSHLEAPTYLEKALNRARGITELPEESFTIAGLDKFAGQNSCFKFCPYLRCSQSNDHKPRPSGTR
ncbi:hypothetical protein QW71_17040 [Paenibacillus sp. IHB B 3415]|uniref:hypothetical protein n=1 Tax=Paenibacillus sp. IHB B 3415 TaxID=867080 RepID=UPI000574C63C|nr:hypothetical protein [Paenibacillus sp. IHB B 3415]KHL94585.1 hypothetical protein QW71_17040 [Paenibacillus sp. IHB B 3415]